MVSVYQCTCTSNGAERLPAVGPPLSFAHSSALLIYRLINIPVNLSSLSVLPFSSESVSGRVSVRKKTLKVELWLTVRCGQKESPGVWPKILPDLAYSVRQNMSKRDALRAKLYPAARKKNQERVIFALKAVSSVWTGVALYCLTGSRKEVSSSEKLDSSPCFPFVQLKVLCSASLTTLQHLLKIDSLCILDVKTETRRERS